MPKQSLKKALQKQLKRRPARGCVNLRNCTVPAYPIRNLQQQVKVFLTDPNGPMDLKLACLNILLYYPLTYRQYTHAQIHALTTTKSGRQLLKEKATDFGKVTTATQRHYISFHLRKKHDRIRKWKK